MKTLKHLYNIIYDDLKDAEMHVNYAEDMVKEGHKQLADSVIVNAKNRLTHAMKIHEEFVAIVKTMKEGHDTKDKVGECLWDSTHEHFVEWYNKIDSCITKWK